MSELLANADFSNVVVPPELYRSRALVEGKRPIVSLTDVRKTYIMGKNSCRTTLENT